MKQKIVIKVQFRCNKCRSKAMKIAAVADGVTSVALEEKDKDNKLVVTGDGVDATTIITRLRKKMGHAELISVEELKEKKEEKKEKKDLEPEPTSQPAASSYQFQWYLYDPYYPTHDSIKY